MKKSTILELQDYYFTLGDCDVVSGEGNPDSAIIETTINFSEDYGDVC